MVVDSTRPKSAEEAFSPVQPDLFTSFLNGFVILSASWTIYCNLLVYAGATFATLVRLCVVPLVIVGGLYYYYCWLRRLEHKRFADSLEVGLIRSSHVPWFVKLLVVAAILTAYTLTGDYILCWLAAVGFLVLASMDEQVKPDPGARCPRNRAANAKWVVVTLGLLAILITLIAHRPDADDAFYLNVPVSSLDHPGWPLMRFDSMFGEPGLPILAPFYRVTSYELFVGFVSFLSRLAPGTLYYIVFPALFAAFVVIAHWAALRELTGNGAPVWGLVLVMVVLLSWGDVHRSYGNFSFVRLFQGKSALVSICVPATVYYAARFARQRDIASWLMLSLVQITALGFSSTGLVVAPIVAVTVLACAWHPNRADTKMMIAGGLSSLYLIVLLVLVVMQTVRRESIGSILSTGNTPGPIASLTSVLGCGGRAYMAVFALLALPAVPGTIAESPGFARFSLVIVLTVFNPLTSQLVGRLAGGTDADALSWRMLWAVPFPLIIALMGTRAMDACRAIGRRGLGIGSVVSLAAVFALAPGNWTLSRANHTHLGLPEYNVDEGYRVAALVVSVTTPNSLVLAPQAVSAWVPLFPGHPRLVGVRDLYLGIIANAFGKPEAERRLMMVNYIEGAADANKSLPAVMEEIQRRGVTTVVVPSHLPWQQAFGEKLRAIGYRSEPAGDYILWTRQCA